MIIKPQDIAVALKFGLLAYEDYLASEIRAAEKDSLTIILESNSIPSDFLPGFSTVHATSISVESITDENDSPPVIRRTDEILEKFSEAIPEFKSAWNEADYRLSTISESLGISQ